MMAHGKLGKQPAKHDPRTLELGKHIDKVVFAGRALPTKVFDTPNISSWPMYKNDEWGDCVPAAAGHVIQLMTKMGSGTEQRVTDDDILRAYSAVTGFNPNDPSTDNGTVMLDFLNYWRTTGVGGHKIVGFASFNPKSFTEWKAAEALFGAAFIGVDLPLSAQDQSDPNSEWRVHGTTGDGAAGSWGGHCIPGFDFSRYETDCITWAYRQRMTWSFAGTYSDEAYVVFDESWVSTVTKKAPSGLDVNELMQALSQFS